jgi:hypothetical protein
VAATALCRDFSLRKIGEKLGLDQNYFTNWNNLNGSSIESNFDLIPVFLTPIFLTPGEI